MSDQLCEQVKLAAGRLDVCDAVRELYARVQAKVDERKPVCVVSGRCCRFEEYGHRLYVTTIELAVFVEEFRRHALAPTAGGSTGRGHPSEASSRTCPFQIGKLCGVHAIRPFGCRMFYCDPSAEQWQQEQYERFHSELKALHERFGVGYFYVEWRQALAVLGLGGADGVATESPILTRPRSAR